jgi:hypothetical protein
MLIEYFDFHPEMVATCECGWAGRGRDTEIELYESPVVTRHCPKCDSILLSMEYPTFNQVREAAEAGNEEAVRMARMYCLEFKAPTRRPH